MDSTTDHRTNNQTNHQVNLSTNRASNPSKHHQARWMAGCNYVDEGGVRKVGDYPMPKKVLLGTAPLVAYSIASLFGYR